MNQATAGAGRTTSIWELLKDPRYLAFWLAGALIGVVRWFQLLALGVFTFETTNSPLLVSLVPLLSMAPMAMFGPIIGAVADRLDRKRLFAISIAGIAITSGIMAAIAMTGTLHFGHVAFAAFMNGIFWATDMPIRRRLLGDLSGDALPTAMSLDAATGNGTRMVGPLLGGAVLQFVGVQGIFLFSVVTYSLCIVLVMFVRVQGRTIRSGPTSLIHDLRAGIRYVRGDMHLRRILGITVIFNVFGFPFTAMIPVIGKVHLAQDPFWTGIVSSLEGMGALIGAILVAMIARPRNYYPLYLRGTIGYISAIYVLAISLFFIDAAPEAFGLVAVILVIAGICGAWFAAMQSTLTYLGAAPEYRSRVLGVLTLCIGAAPFGFFNIGWMASLWGAPTALFIMASEGMIMLLLLRLTTPIGRPDPGHHSARQTSPPTEP
ncbi:MAG: MFS transporter [Alphaproteobacteria bacterium]|jgi:MFS family permease